ncbi:hypothetical protein AB0L05_36615 [Nonomuraea pusilla]|uniref:hypothetical protein n=1 Tax=Nonomuraea pusilla TaxID=46177 RepID=UPI00331CA016
MYDGQAAHATRAGPAPLPFQATPAEATSKAAALEAVVLEAAALEVVVWEAVVLAAAAGDLGAGGAQAVTAAVASVSRPAVSGTHVLRIMRPGSSRARPATSPTGGTPPRTFA